MELGRAHRSAGWSRAHRCAAQERAWAFPAHQLVHSREAEASAQVSWLVASAQVRCGERVWALPAHQLVQSLQTHEAEACAQVSWLVASAQVRCGERVWAFPAHQLVQPMRVIFPLGSPCSTCDASPPSSPGAQSAGHGCARLADLLHACCIGRGSPLPLHCDHAGALRCVPRTHPAGRGATCTSAGLQKRAPATPGLYARQGPSPPARNPEL